VLLGAASAILFAVAASGQIIGSSELLDNGAGQNQRWSGVGRFQNGISCTAFLIRPPGAGDGSPAYVISSGHCINTSPPNEVVLDRGLAATSRVTFRYFRDAARDQLPVRALRAVHSTMKGLDLAVVELESALGALTTAGITPLELSEIEPERGEAVWNVGVPTSSIPADEQFLRIGTCSIGHVADLIEFTWHFWASYSNACPDIYGGSSGSPLISQRSGRVVAAMNTTTLGASIETGDFRCFSGQPCEVVAGGFRYLPETNYAVPVIGLARCFDSEGIFRLSRDGCPLDPGEQLSITFPARAGKPGTRWNAVLSGSLPYYRYKVVGEGTDDCRSERGYGTPIELAMSNRITDPLPEQARRYYLCVLAGRSPEPDSTWQQAKFATMIHYRVDDSPPTIPIPYQFVDAGESYVTQPIFQIPELSDYRYKLADTASDTCDSPQGYRPYLRVAIRIQKNPGAHRICYIGADEAGNETAPLELVLQGTQIFPPGVRNAASLRTGPIAAGSLATVYGVNLDLIDLELTDRTGRKSRPEVLYSSAGQVNFRVPAEAAPGDAALNETVRVLISRTGPGIFNVRLGEPVQSAFTIYATGVDSDATVSVSGVSVPTVIAGELVAGVVRLDVSLPEEFRLRGYLPVTVRSRGEASPPVTMRFR
jgi:hypothetical protein